MTRIFTLLVLITATSHHTLRSMGEDNTDDGWASCSSSAVPSTSSSPASKNASSRIPSRAASPTLSLSLAAASGDYEPLVAHCLHKAPLTPTTKKVVHTECVSALQGMNPKLTNSHDIAQTIVSVYGKRLEEKAKTMIMLKDEKVLDLAMEKRKSRRCNLLALSYFCTSAAVIGGLLAKVVGHCE